MAEKQTSKLNPRIKDISGRRFGSLTALRLTEVLNRKSMWLCICDCGQQTTVAYGNLAYGQTKGCGKHNPGRIKQLSGKTFGRLTVIDMDRSADGKTYWRCRCACGVIKIVLRGSLTSGGTKSCGCLNAELIKTRGITHGQSKTKEYKVWGEVKNRCYNPNDTHYQYYGGRGIQMCQRWQDSFADFIADMGPRPAGSSLERVNNDGHYEPGNVIWADPKTQMRNRSNNVRVTHNGQTLTIVEWSERTGINAKLLYQRYAAHGVNGLFDPIQSKYSH